MKFKNLTILSVAIVCITMQTAYCEENSDNYSIYHSELEEKVPYKLNGNIKPLGVNPVRTRKKNVKTYKEFGSNIRIASNTTAKKERDAEITVGVSRTFGGSISGVIEGLGISKNVSLTVNTTRKFVIPKGKTAYPVARPIYSVEKGTREVYNSENGKILGKNNYTVKRVVGIDYTLVYVK